jgi:hypothetical protein
MSIGAKYLYVVGAGLALMTSVGSTSAQVLSPAQIVNPANLTEKESAYYQKLSDPEVAKNFIVTRSYVRLCQQVIDHELPAIQLPDKPLGFSARYLLPGEATLINTALSESIIAGVKADRPNH